MSVPITISSTATVLVTGPNTIQVVTAGVPGTPGTGSVTTAQWNSLSASVTALQSGPVAWSNTTVSLANGGGTPLSPADQASPTLVEFGAAGLFADSGAGRIVQANFQATNSGSRSTAGLLATAVATGIGAVVVGARLKGLGNAVGAGAVVAGGRVDYGFLQGSGTAYGLQINAEGSIATTAAIQITSDTAGSAPTNGIVFDGTGAHVANNAFIGTAGNPSTNYGIDFTGGSFSVAVLAMPNTGAVKSLTQSGSAVQHLLSLDASNALLLHGGDVNINSLGKMTTLSGFSAIGGIDGGYVLLDAFGTSAAQVTSTASTVTYAAAITRNFTLPTGTWTVLLVGILGIFGDSNTDDAVLHLSNDTTEATGSNVTSTPGVDDTNSEMVGTLTGQTGAHNYFIGYHVNTSGTIHAYKPTILIFGKRTA